MDYLALQWENERLQQIIGELKDELFEEREKHSRAIDLLIAGESLRQQIMLDAILGKFPPKLEATNVVEV